MLRNTTLLVATCLVAGSPLLAQEKAAPKKPPVVTQKIAPAPNVKEITAADIKKHEASNPKGKMVKFKPPVVVKDEEVKAPPPPPAPPVVKKDQVKPPPPPPAPPVIKRDVKTPPPPPPAPPKKN